MVARGDERRKSPRRTIEISTTLIYKDLSIAECRTRDIGFGGAFVYTPITPPPTNARVKMLLIRRDKTIPLALESTVLHSTEKGAALCFKNVSIEANDTLVDLLFSWNAPAAVSRPTSGGPITGGHMSWK